MSALDEWRKAEGRRNRPERPVEPAPEVPLGTIYVKSQHREARPGSQRRCYHGCFPSSDWDILWSEWRPLITDVPESALEGWQGFTRDDLKTEYKWEQNQ